MSALAVPPGGVVLADQAQIPAMALPSCKRCGNAVLPARKLTYRQARSRTACGCLNADAKAVRDGRAPVRQDLAQM